ncbi:MULTISPECIES: rhodanese-like domain-containing protein [Halolamina]|uniref:Rhodanese-related sulfurtransferase n=1 Tax=Halolamina pelagica TaxID=699431 RepID=A0A1I5UAK3_9EURY|nr:MULTISPECIES: rhodanese-like domain-containing protein [Halolamina]NHX37199.1 rhodanese-like domain-containing protein [Halolamina sp. R1-12]SFP92242.1 Rhodanese-related sulfurtransferase [Halolamina pelagica]
MDEISPGSVAELLADGAAPTVVDIRNPAAFRRGHIPGSLNLPFGQLPDRVAELADADHVVTVCPHGKSSVQAAKLIESYEGTADATVESMAGGLSAWDGPIESGSDDGRSEPDEGPAPF